MRRKPVVMLSAGLVLMAGGVVGVVAGWGATPAVDDSHLPLPERFEAGATWTEFLEEQPSRPQEWRDRYEAGAVSVAGVLPGLSAGSRDWRLLVVAEAWCGDSRESLPYLAKLADEAPNLELRVLSKSQGSDLLAAHPAEGGRKAIPLVVVLDESWRVRGAWVEQPEALRRLIREESGRVDGDRLLEMIRRWREEDQGRAVLSEVVQLILAADAERG